MFVRFGRISWAEGLHTILYKISRTDYSWRERLSAKNHLSKTNLQGGHKKLQFVSWMLATLKIKHRAAPVILRLVKSFSIRLLFTKNLNGLSEDWFVPHCIFRLFTFSVPTFFKNKKFVNYKIEKLCLIKERKKKGSCSKAGQGGTEAICTRLLMRSWKSSVWITSNYCKAERSIRSPSHAYSQKMVTIICSTLRYRELEIDKWNEAHQTYTCWEGKVSDFTYKKIYYQLIHFVVTNCRFL